MRKYIQIFILILISPVSLTAQTIDLPEPDVTSIRAKMERGNNESEAIYYYLAENFKPASEKINKAFYEWNKTSVCAFTRLFETHIKYSIQQCREAGGTSVTVEFPKIEQQKIMHWVERIYEIDKSGFGHNVWRDHNTKFEPAEPEPGCYFEIKQQADKTVVELYCGC